MPGLSRSRLQALIFEGRVLCDGKPAKASSRLRGGEAVEVTIPAPAPAVPAAQELPVSILFQDADLAVIDKAPGMVVHPGAGHAEGTLVNALLFHLEDLAGVGGELRPGIVHRLDKETSGCLVVAKHERSLQALQEAFKSRAVEKRYLALVHGAPLARGRIETKYGRHPVHRKKFSGKVREGKPAITEYAVRERFGGAALVEVNLLTGRTHQIRVHLSEAGHPLLGDALYGGARRGKGTVAQAQQALGRVALHAWRLSLPHPRTGKRMDFEAPIPADFQRAVEVLRAGA